jgi:hypothetical protein
MGSSAGAPPGVAAGSVLPVAGSLASAGSSAGASAPPVNADSVVASSSDVTRPPVSALTVGSGSLTWATLVTGSAAPTSAVTSAATWFGLGASPASGDATLGAGATATLGGTGARCAMVWLTSTAPLAPTNAVHTTAATFVAAPAPPSVVPERIAPPPPVATPPPALAAPAAPAPPPPPSPSRPRGPAPAGRIAASSRLVRRSSTR